MSFQDFCKYFYVQILLKHWHLLNIFTFFKTYSQLINGVGNTQIEIFTDIRIPSNNAWRKGKELDL